MSGAEYHPNPNGHYVVDDPTWRRLLAGFKGNATTTSRALGQMWTTLAMPVYIDNCPWDCDAPMPSTPLEGTQA